MNNPVIIRKPRSAKREMSEKLVDFLAYWRIMPPETGPLLLEVNFTNGTAAEVFNLRRERSQP